MMLSLLQVFAHVSQFSTDLRIPAERVEHALKEQEKIWKATNGDILRMVELLRKQQAEKEEKHIHKVEEVNADAKASAAVAVWEAKIKLADDLENLGSWNVVG